MGGPAQCVLTIQETNDCQRYNHDQTDPEKGLPHVSARGGREDGDRHGLGAARYIAGKHQRRSEFTHRTGKCQHRSRDHAGRSQRQKHPAEDHALRGSKSSCRIEKILIDLVESSQSGPIHQRKSHHGCGNDRCRPGEDDGDADLLQRMADETSPA